MATGMAVCEGYEHIVMCEGVGPSVHSDVSRSLEAFQRLFAVALDVERVRSEPVAKRTGVRQGTGHGDASGVLLFV